MSRLVIIALLSSCASDQSSKRQIATSSNSKIVDDGQRYFYEAYKMSGYRDSRYIAIKIEVSDEIPQKLYLVDLASSEPWVKVSNVIEASLDCSSSTTCQGRAGHQEFALSWVEKAQVVGQLVIYRDQDDGTRATHVYNRALTAIGEQLGLGPEVIQQQYFDELTEDPIDSAEDGFYFMVGGQKDRFEIEVDQVFFVSFKMTDTTSEVARSPRRVRIEAYDRNGNIVEEVLASAGTLDHGGGTIFDPYASTVLMVSSLTTNYPVFFVPEAISRRVTKLVGYAEGVKTGEVAINLLPSTRTMTAESDGNETSYVFTPKPDANLGRGDYRWLHLIFKELDGNGMFTSNNFDTEHDPHAGGVSSYSDNRPDNYRVTIDGLLPCVAPHTIYAWLQTDIAGKKVLLENRKLYRIDCP